MSKKKTIQQLMDESFDEVPIKQYILYFIDKHGNCFDKKVYKPYDKTTLKNNYILNYNKLYNTYHDNSNLTEIKVQACYSDGITEELKYWDIINL